MSPRIAVAVAGRAAGERERCWRVPPHEIAVSLQPVPDAWPARLTHSATVGPVTRLEFAVEGRDAPVNVELPRAEFRALSLATGTIAYLRATNIRHFARSPG